MVRLSTLLLFLVILAVGALVGSLVFGLFPSAEVASSEAAPGPAPQPPLRVEVLNASGIRGQAWAATRQLRSQGFDVVYFGNAPAFDAESTLVIDRAEVIDHARMVADSLDVRRIVSESDDDLYLDVTVLLGRDWRPEAENGLGQSAAEHR